MTVSLDRKEISASMRKENRWTNYDEKQIKDLNALAEDYKDFMNFWMSYALCWQFSLHLINIFLILFF